MRFTGAGPFGLGGEDFFSQFYNYSIARGGNTDILPPLP